MRINFDFRDQADSSKLLRSLGDQIILFTAFRSAAARELAPAAHGDGPDGRGRGKYYLVACQKEPLKDDNLTV